MHITFVCECCIDDKNTFSGIPYFMAKALQENGEPLNFIQVPGYDLQTVYGADINQGRAEFVRSSQYLSEQLKNIETDVIICLTGSMIPYLDIKKPVILWHDSTWFTLSQLNFNEFKQKYPLLYEADQLTLDKCSLVIFPADWLREQVLSVYHVDPGKIHVIPFGANIEPFPFEIAENTIAKRESSPCKLTFIGKEWERKGLPLAYELTETLNANGINTVLIVVGCSVKLPSRKRLVANALRIRRLNDVDRFTIQLNRSKNVNKIGFLDKEDPSQYRLFEKILSDSHFLVHPAHFECYGLVMPEANAYGVPVLALNQYGPQTIVRNGVNGYLFDKSQFVEGAFCTVKRLMDNYPSYTNLARSSFQEYVDRLNWSTSVHRLKQLIQKVSPC